MAESWTRGKQDIGDLIQRLMKARDLKPAEVEVPGWSTRTLYRLLKGEVLPKQLDRLLDLVKALSLDPVADVQVAEKLWHRAQESAFAHESSFSPTYRLFRHVEARAVHICTVESILVPGLLQTPRYTSLVAAASPRASEPGWAASVARERSERQRLVLHRREPAPPRYSVLLAESVIGQTLAAPDVWREQMSYLMTEARDRPHVSLRLLPRTMPPSDLRTGTTNVLRTRDGATEVFVDSLSGMQQLSKLDDVGWIGKEWNRLASFAMSEEDSLRFIQRAIKAL